MTATTRDVVESIIERVFVRAIQDRLGLFQELGIVKAELGGVQWMGGTPNR